ncbi:hypothetical protein K502DRAFT_347776 [Neoconidiobolus thromboides FSU 785]|nr:hypothetical protein K502DRAFT_347776 [Neoconidiobolus thromboides FSU 785]
MMLSVIHSILEINQKGIILCIILLLILNQNQFIKQNIIHYGRNKDNRMKSGWLTISKKKFNCFYLFLIVTNLLFVSFNFFYKNQLLIEYNLDINYYSKYYNTNTISEHAIYLPLLLQFQGFRRYYETIKIHQFSANSKMNVLILLLGIYYYFNLSLLLNFNAVLSYAIYKQNHTSLTTDVTFYFSIALFFYSSYHQFNCHVDLANLRNNDIKEKYSLPLTSYFKYCSNPHYYHELLIYLSFLLMDQFKSLNLIFISLLVVLNLIITAYSNHHWYFENMPKYKHIVKNRHAILPQMAWFY